MALLFLALQGSNDYFIWSQGKIGGIRLYNISYIVPSISFGLTYLDKNGLLAMEISSVIIPTTVSEGMIDIKTFSLSFLKGYTQKSKHFMSSILFGLNIIPISKEISRSSILIGFPIIASFSFNFYYIGIGPEIYLNLNPEYPYFGFNFVLNLGNIE